MEYFECDVPSGDGLCSDNSCPCPEVLIPHGTGYLYIEKSLVDFRRQYPTMESARKAMQLRQDQMRASNMMFTGFYRLGPILVCEQGAKLRNLDLEVAATDAKYWWETGKVPLRATPIAGSKKGPKGREIVTKKDLSFLCEGCGQSYTLGKDALVVTSLGVMADFQAVTVPGDDSTFVDNRADPDLVDSLERSWSSLEPSVARSQQDEMSRLSLSLSKGKPRWWKCRKCDTVQTYQLIPIPSKQFERKTVEEAWAAAMPAIPKERIVDGKTNGLAIASLILGIVSVPSLVLGCGIFLGIAAFITGLIARQQVKESDGTQSGAGMALAGIILGGLIVLLTGVLIIIVLLISEGS